MKECDHIRKMRWTDITADVRTQLDGLAPQAKGDDSLYIGRYPFGAIIIDDGRVQPPGGRATSCKSCQEAVGRLDRDAIPVAMVLDGAVEVGLIANDSRWVSLRLISKGEVFGTFEFLDRFTGLDDRRERPWKLYSGARGVEILLTLGNADLQKKIAAKLGGADRENPWRLIEYAAAQHRSTTPAASPWQWVSQIAFIPREWLDSSKKHADAQQLMAREVVWRFAWEQSQPHRRYRIDEFELRAAWANMRSPDEKSEKKGIERVFTKQVDERYIYAVLRQILDVSRGDSPGLRWCRKAGAEAGPFSSYEAYIAEAAPKALTQYFPAVLQPVHLRARGDVAYISLARSACDVPAPVDVKDLRAQLVEPLDLALRTLRERQLSCFASLDFEELAIYCDKPPNVPTEFVRTFEQFPAREFLPDTTTTEGARPKLQLNSSILRACVKVVRK
jgi:hypothetical protein